MHKPSVALSRRKHRIAIFVTGVLGLPLAPLPVAAGCFEPSPLAQPGADPHAALEPTHLSRAQRKAIESIFRSLRGRWRGTARGHFCTGTDKSPEKVQDDATLHVEFKAERHHTVVMYATLTAASRGSSRNERLELILSDKTLRVGSDNPAGDSRVLFAERNHISFATKSRFTRRRGGGGYNEVHRYIQASPTGLSIEFKVYSQGGLSATSRWTARRR